ncbi:MAG: hypothetical protein D6706_17110 [Chloroflexi bacterium]|nr:MAG: hypothetical protein D6706_17110 [Chloroflexota bacterium]
MQNEMEVMRIIRLPPLGKMVVEVNGRRYTHLSEIEGESDRRRLLAAIAELVTFAGGYEVLAETGLVPPVSGASTSKPRSQQPAMPKTAEETPEQRRLLAEMELKRDALKSMPREQRPFPLSGLVPKPKVDVESIKPMIPSPEERPTSSLTIIQQIDQILQKHVQATPQTASRSIHLVEDPAGGLRIEVDGKFYTRPSEIEDVTIKMLIKRALKEWESR